jgi:GntR family transcriptional regulator
MKFVIDPSSPVPLHVQVETLLKEMIKDPAYKDGALLQPEVDMAKELGISRNTLRHAMNKLIFEGLLVRKKGFGTKVSETSLSTELDKWTSFSQEMTEKGLPFKTFSTKVSFERVSDYIAGVFDIIPDSDVLRLEQLHGMKEDPIVLFVSYLHPDIGLTGDEDFSLPLYDILAQFNTTPNLSKEEISAQPAGAYLANILDIKRSDPVLVRKRKVYDINDNIIEYNICYYRSNKITFLTDIKR